MRFRKSRGCPLSWRDEFHLAADGFDQRDPAGVDYLYFDVREKPWLAILLQRCSSALAGVAPEVEKKFRAVLAVIAEVAVFAQIDLRVEDSGQDPTVLEEIVSRRWLDGAVRQGPLRRKPRDDSVRGNDRGGGKSGEFGHKYLQLAGPNTYCGGAVLARYN